MSWLCYMHLDSYAGPGDCGSATSTEDGLVRVRGDGTTTLRAELQAIAFDDYDCCCCVPPFPPGTCVCAGPLPYHSHSWTTPTLTIPVTVDIPGSPPGTEVTVRCRWGFSKRARPEGPLTEVGGGNLRCAALIGGGVA